MLQLEELEGHFVEFEEFTEQLGSKREEIYEAFQKQVTLPSGGYIVINQTDICQRYGPAG